MWRHLILVGVWGAGLLCAAAEIHTVKRGETLYQISHDYDVTVAEILRANPALGSGRMLKVGQKIRIPESPPTAPDPSASPEKKSPSPADPASRDEAPPTEVTENADAPEVYTVRRGDTLSSIGRRYKISPGELREINKLKSNTLVIGQKLRVRSQITVRSDEGDTPPPPPRTATRSAVGVGGQSSSRPPPELKPRYLFIDKVKAKIDAPRVKSGRWKYVVVHHSGTPSGNARIFDDFHRNIRGMENGLAYHFVIGNGHDSGDGEIEVGDRWTRQIQGGHLRSDELNEIALGICFVGDFNSSRPTKKQIAACIELITYLNQICGKPPVFKAHREINPKPTECPGKNFPVKAFHQLFDSPG